jgi:hypothetical protein
LRNILRSISLSLPENYELAAISRFKSIRSYYELIKVPIVGSLLDVKLIIYVPIKTANQQFTVYKITGLLNRIGKMNLFKLKPIFHTLKFEAFSVTTPCLQKINYNNARQASLETDRLAQTFLTYKLLHVRQVYIFRVQVKINSVMNFCSES